MAVEPGAPRGWPETSAAVRAMTSTAVASQTRPAATAALAVARRAPLSRSERLPGSGATKKAAVNSRPVVSAAARSCTARTAGSP